MRLTKTDCDDRRMNLLLIRMGNLSRMRKQMFCSFFYSFVWHKSILIVYLLLIRLFPMKSTQQKKRRNRERETERQWHLVHIMYIRGTKLPINHKNQTDETRPDQREREYLHQYISVSSNWNERFSLLISLTFWTSIIFIFITLLMKTWLTFYDWMRKE